jgi:hypoxanthine phosphoribosyltransferase
MDSEQGMRVVVEGREVTILPLHTEEEIARCVSGLAEQVSRDYEGKDLVTVGVLKGAFVFTADLVRRLTVPCRSDFLALGSYGSRSVSSGEVELLLDLRIPLRGRDVLVVEDIVDTGLSLQYALERVRREEPGSLKVCALLDKPSRRKVEVPVDYVGFTVPDRFLVGYGLDWNERFRHLPYVGYVEGL